MNLFFYVSYPSLCPTPKTKEIFHPHLTIVSIVRYLSRRSSTLSKCCTLNLLVHTHFDFLLQFGLSAQQSQNKARSPLTLLHYEVTPKQIHMQQLDSIVHLLAQLDNMLHTVYIASKSLKSQGKYSLLHV
jgi:hypothetical protein